ncbi:UDP-glycosyltransferase 73C5 [Dendrobium catenatum]|uniref:UDP-glycosyltransferase 73C5 n=1 Tax=Dendrobium catenatum TaxID=906689 RepID=A0A2I0WGZ3_9ASPA|nr:UDP-glycosyltransferase 73C5 [Dendrobium catenatum]
MASFSALEILFFPFPSPGHYLPLIDIATLIASRGANATVVINPVILSRLPPSLLRTAGIHFHSIPFPSAAAGLPDGISTADDVPTALLPRFAVALSLLRSPFTDLLRHLSPSAVISDALLPFTAETAASLGIPWFSFPGTGLFALSVDLSIFLNRPHQTEPISDSFVVPGLPHRIELTHSQLKETTLPGRPTSDFFALAKQADQFTTGIVINSFTDLEPGYAEHYQREMGKRIFLIGPVSTIRCSEEEEQNSQIMTWLKKKPERSVIYVCFGSLCRMPEKQILEIGRGLEDSGVAFIWVIREASASPEVAEIEQRVGKRGIIVRGWIAGQAAVLRHPSIGGFLTHCGWGAVTEAVAAGIPMLTWPMFGEQFYNEKLVNELVGIGVEIGATEGFVWGEEEKNVVLVGRERISERVRLLMDNSTGSGSGSHQDIEGVRKSVKEMKEKARKAIAEGGSSYLAVESLLEHCRFS